MIDFALNDVVDGPKGNSTDRLVVDHQSNAFRADHLTKSDFGFIRDRPNGPFNLCDDGPRERWSLDCKQHLLTYLVTFLTSSENGANVVHFSLLALNQRPNQRPDWRLFIIDSDNKWAVNGS